MRRQSQILGGRNEGAEWGEAGEVSPGEWRPSQMALGDTICPTLNLGPQLTGLWICFVISSEQTPASCSGKKSLLLFKISRPSPPLHFAQVQTTMKISPTQAIHPSLRTAHTNKQTPKTQEAYTVRNLHAYKQTGLLICSRVGGLSPKCRQDIAAVKGEIVQSYLPSTDQGGIPKTELTQLINLPHCCLSQLPSFQATCGIVIF